MQQHEPSDTRRSRASTRGAHAIRRASRPKPLRVALLAAFVATAPLAAAAQEVVAASPDVTIARSVVVADEDVVLDNQLGLVTLENLGALPVAAEVVAFGLAPGGGRLFAFETTTALPGGVIARPGDVIRFDGSSHTVAFDAIAAGLPRGAVVDAVSLAPEGLLLSFDTTVELSGGVVAADEDLLDWDGVSFAVALDGSTVGVDAALDVDAAQDLGGGSFLVSFDTAGEVGGVAFSDEDILRFESGSWSLEYDADAADTAWGAADLDALTVPEPSRLPGLAVGCLVLATLSCGARSRAGARSWTDGPSLTRVAGPRTGPPAGESRSASR
jgi:hypothetical protein